MSNKDTRIKDFIGCDMCGIGMGIHLYREPIRTGYKVIIRRKMKSGKLARDKDKKVIMEKVRQATYKLGEWITYEHNIKRPIKVNKTVKKYEIELNEDGDPPLMVWNEYKLKKVCPECNSKYVAK